MNFPTPQPGDVITVTCRHKDIHVNRTSDVKDTTYENVRVVEPFDWLSKFEFCIPADGPESQAANIETVEKLGSRAPKFTTRVIHMRNVVMLNGEIADEFDDSVREVEVPASKGGTYTVRLEGGIGVSCTCTGFQFRKKCRHLKEAEETVHE